jgi:molybdopterin/thiamine biosynthesis adenylyltransferase/rhodanese-related sulfurtransferase
MRMRNRITSTPPDYSRQTLLKEVGIQGQARLAAARVLVVGAGGLGSPVLQYLAGAGVGCLGVIDADVLDASNLHRQPIYRAADVGKRKVDLARAAIDALNPSIQIETHALRLDESNALELIRRYDLIIDCSDNFRTKYLINDAAVLAQRPAVFASVYQYEGQLQVYKPDPGHACLRCLWPDAMADGVVGNCAEAGVLGPVPGAFGTLQAFMALKILLNMHGQLEGELLLLDFMSFSTTRLKARRRVECLAPACAHISALESDGAELELAISSLAEARARGFHIVDIRTDAELSVAPSGVRHVPMAALLADPSMAVDPKDPGRPVLLLCASGKRSLAAAKQLRRQNINVQSIAGGMQALEADVAVQK